MLLWALAAALSLVFTVTPAVGYAPLQVTLRARVIQPPPEATLCFSWKETSGPFTDEEHLSCQPVIPPWVLYEQVIRLPCGTWTISAFIESNRETVLASPSHPVRVLSSAGDPRPCDEP